MYLTAALGLALTAYYTYKSRPQKTDPMNYLIYTAFMLAVATVNQILTRATLTALVPVIEETYKILAARLTPAKNKYVLSGVVFGTIEMISYIMTAPTKEMFLARANVIYIHPTSMLIYSKLKNKLNTLAAFFAATTYHGLWNLLTTTHPWKTPEITAAYITFSTLLAALTLGKENTKPTRGTAATVILFLAFAAVTYSSTQHPIIGEPGDDNWVMNITIIEPNGTYRAIIYNTVINGTTTHIETIWTGSTTTVYTLTLTKNLTTPTTTALTRITTATITTSTTTTTTQITTTTTVAIAPPATPQKITKITTRVVAFDWHSIVVWASIVSESTTIIGYTTFYY